MMRKEENERERGRENKRENKRESERDCERRRETKRESDGQEKLNDWPIYFISVVRCFDGVKVFQINFQATYALSLNDSIHLVKVGLSGAHSSETRNNVAREIYVFIYM